MSSLTSTAAAADVAPMASARPSRPLPPCSSWSRTLVSSGATPMPCSQPSRPRPRRVLSESEKRGGGRSRVEAAGQPLHESHGGKGQYRPEPGATVSASTSRCASRRISRAATAISLRPTQNSQLLWEAQPLSSLATRELWRGEVIAYDHRFQRGINNRCITT